MRHNSRRQDSFKKIIGGLLAALLIAGWVMNAAPARSQSRSGNLFARDLPPAETFSRGVKFYRSGDYEKALDTFRFLVTNYPTDGGYSRALFMAAKCEYKLGKYSQADARLDEFLKTFPNSSYRGAALLLKGDIAYLAGDPVEAAQLYIRSYESTSNPEHKQLARDRFLPLVRDHLNVEALDRIEDTDSDSEILADYYYYKGMKEYRAGLYSRAKRDLEHFAATFPSDSRMAQVEFYLRDSARKAQSQVEIGLLAPLSGPYKRYGDFLLAGVQAATKRFEAKTGVKVQLVIKDTRGDIVETARVTQELFSTSEPVCVIGPLRSETAVVAGLIAEQHETPLITPTASQDGIADLGKGIFQVSPSEVAMAEQVARYASGALGLRSFAMMLPLDDIGKACGEVFRYVVESSGGRIVAQVDYERGSTDFSDQLRIVREALIDSSLALFDAGLLDSALYMYPDTAVVDTSKLPVFLDGLFVPGYSEEIRLIAPQVAFSIIETRLVGTAGFSDWDVLKDVKQYVEGAVFVTDFVQERSEAWVRFSSDFQRQFGLIPDRVSALSYDAATLVYEALKEGHREPGNVSAYLFSVSGFDGISGRITFAGTNGQNRELTLCTIGPSGVETLGKDEIKDRFGTGEGEHEKR